MLKLTGDVGVEFTLDVVSYQFPDVLGGGLDSEWLVVEGAVKTADGPWRFRDPCLTSVELGEIAWWLRKIERGEFPDALGFIEPNLRFEYGEDGTLTISFSQEAAPPWATEDQKYGKGVAVRFSVRRDDIRRCTDAVEKLALAFPRRSI